MIDEISIRDLGVIAEATLPLGPGLTCLTGETGAGKTMVVTAVGLLLGERADPGRVRAGAKQSWVEGVWGVEASGPVADRVRDAGGDLDPNLIDPADVDAGRSGLLLGRSVSPEGRSRAVVGGRSAPANVLAEIGSQLVVVHGQSEQVRLKSQAAQRDLLDRFGGDTLQSALASYADAWTDWRADRAELDTLIGHRDERAREEVSLREFVEDVTGLAPQPGEDDELRVRVERLANLEDLRLAGSDAREALSAETMDAVDVTALLDSARRGLERVSGHDPALAEIAGQVAEAGYLVADVAATLSSYLAGLDSDGARELEAVNERRAELGALSRKYSIPVDELAERSDAAIERLQELVTDGSRIDLLTARVDDGEARTRSAADRLTAVRTSSATELAARVTEELAALAMPDARLHVEITRTDALTASGQDQVELLLSPHVGAPARPIARSASGGELSRVMLAVEVVIAGTTQVPTFVFDEVDAGVGGAAAIEIGRRLARLATTAQVIVVTHLAQVAAFATNHLSVEKNQDGEYTASSVRQLTGDARIAEMARLLSGLPDSASGLEHARELLEVASAP